MLLLIWMCSLMGCTVPEESDLSEEITEEQRAYLEKIISDSDKYDTDETKDIVIDLGELYD